MYLFTLRIWLHNYFTETKWRCNLNNSKNCNVFINKFFVFSDSINPRSFRKQHVIFSCIKLIIRYLWYVEFAWFEFCINIIGSLSNSSLITAQQILEYFVTRVSNLNSLFGSRSRPNELIWINSVKGLIIQAGKFSSKNDTLKLFVALLVDCRIFRGK